MNMKSEKGISSIDVIISIFLITTFVVLLTMASGRLASSEKEIDRVSDAIYYANNLIEEIKAEDISMFTGISNADLDNLESIDVDDQSNLEKYSVGYVVDDKGNETAYFREVFVIDYADIDLDAQREKLKKVIVKISYKEQNQVKDITLEAIIRGEA